MENEILDLLGEALKKNFEENQKKPNQYVVAYYKQSDDSLIGYHASTFCQVTQDILDAKRYSGDNPYSQLETIAKNVTKRLLSPPRASLLRSAPVQSSRAGRQQRQTVVAVR